MQRLGVILHFEKDIHIGLLLCDLCIGWEFDKLTLHEHQNLVSASFIQHFSSV
jgi:hypothetical protein